MKILKILTSLKKLKINTSAIVVGLNAVREVLVGIGKLIDITENITGKENDIEIISKAIKIVDLIQSKLDWISGLLGLDSAKGLSKPADTNAYLDKVIKSLEE